MLIFFSLTHKNIVEADVHLQLLGSHREFDDGNLGVDDGENAVDFGIVAQMFVQTLDHGLTVHRSLKRLLKRSDHVTGVKSREKTKTNDVTYIRKYHADVEITVGETEAVAGRPEQTQLCFLVHSSYVHLKACTHFVASVHFLARRFEVVLDALKQLRQDCPVL